MPSADPWDSGLPYETFMGRWSREIARLFIQWLDPPEDLRWLDVGCGTGVLSAQIAELTAPREVLGIDPSPAFISYARQLSPGVPGLHFEVAGVTSIPAPDAYFDIAASGLALNFFPDPQDGLQRIGRAVRPGQLIAAYVWDYADGMQMLRTFWDVAISLDPGALHLDEAIRFPVCRPQPLEAAFAAAGLAVQNIHALETPTVFSHFDDYWQPFNGGTGPAPAYVASLSPERRKDLESALRDALPIQPDGSIPLVARAWAISASV